jgi:dienelactone hydrolase
MKEDRIEFTSAGRSFAGRLFAPDSTGDAARRAVLVLHGGAGIGAHEIERAQTLAGLGYVAFVPDLFGEVFTSRERGVEVITRLVDDAATLRMRLADALACMRSRPGVDTARTAAIGFCFGGLAAIELARSGADLRAVVSFHGGLTARTPAEPMQVKASILVCTGAADPYVTREHRSAFEEEMTGAQADWQMHVYAHAMHGFTERGGFERPGCKYHERADRRSWSAMRALFDEVLV